MVGFDSGVQVCAGSMFRVDRQLALSLQPIDSLRVRAELVCSHRRRWLVAHRIKCFSQKTMGCPDVAAVCQHEVDQATVLINGAKQILPPAARSKGKRRRLNMTQPKRLDTAQSPSQAVNATGPFG